MGLSDGVLGCGGGGGGGVWWVRLVGLNELGLGVSILGLVRTVNDFGRAEYYFVQTLLNNI